MRKAWQSLHITLITVLKLIRI